ncbi:hemopexin fold protein, partial [Tanacetum coccineum]
FDSNEEEVVPKVDDVSLVDGVFDDAFSGEGEEDVIIGEGVVVTSSSLEMLTKKAMELRYEEDEDDKKSGEDSDIGAAFASHISGEAYLFKGNSYVLLHFTPGKTKDYIIGGPKEILPKNWPSLVNILPQDNAGLDIDMGPGPDP